MRGVGGIGAQVEPEPLHYWSELTLVIWDCPERLEHYRIYQDREFSQPPGLWISWDVEDVEDLTPAKRQQLEMVVLVGTRLVGTRTELG